MVEPDRKRYDQTRFIKPDIALVTKTIGMLNTAVNQAALDGEVLDPDQMTQMAKNFMLENNVTDLALNIPTINHGAARYVRLRHSQGVSLDQGLQEVRRVIQPFLLLDKNAYEIYTKSSSDFDNLVGTVMQLVETASKNADNPFGGDAEVFNM